MTELNTTYLAREVRNGAGHLEWAVEAHTKSRLGAVVVTALFPLGAHATEEVTKIVANAAWCAYKRGARDGHLLGRRFASSGDSDEYDLPSIFKQG